MFLCDARFHIQSVSEQTSNVTFFFQGLRVALGEKEQKLKEVEKEVELWRQKEQALTTVLQEKQAQISFLQTALQEVNSMFGTHPRPLTLNSFSACIFTISKLWKDSGTILIPGNLCEYNFLCLTLWLVRIHPRWLIYLSSGRKVAPACARRSLNSPLPYRNTSLWCR